jgi:hypothetical protein
MPVAAELKIWTFYETIDTDLTDSKVHESDRISFQAPITSIKSAILDLYHEVDRTRSGDLSVNYVMQPFKLKICLETVTLMLGWIEKLKLRSTDFMKQGIRFLGNRRRETYVCGLLAVR